MPLSSELAALFHRDLTRLIQELQAFPNDGALWQLAPGVTNSAGNLALHLEGNLRDFIGRQLGGVAYHREREKEFAKAELPAPDLIERITSVSELVADTLSGLSQAQLEATYPEKVFGMHLSTQQFLVHLHGHLNYHLGQIDYLRRITTSGAPVQFAGL